MLLWTLQCMYSFKLAFSFSFPACLGVELLYHVVIVLLVSWGTSVLFFSVATPTSIPTNGVQCSFSPHPCWHIFVVFLIIAILLPVGWSHYGFDLHFCDDYQCWASFHVPFGHLYIFFGKMSIQVFCPLFSQVFFFFNIELYELFALDISPFLVILFANIFSHSVSYLLILVSGFLCSVKVFKFN